MFDELHLQIIPDDGRNGISVASVVMFRSENNRSFHGLMLRLDR